MNTSDIEKQNVHRANLDQCYNNIKNVPLVRFTLDSTIIPLTMVEDRTLLGWISEDVQVILPKSVKKLDYNITKKKIEAKNDSSDSFGTVSMINDEQIYANMYGAVQKLIQDKESLEKTVNEQLVQMITAQQKQISSMQEIIVSLQDKISILQNTNIHPQNTIVSSPITVSSHNMITSLQNTVATLQHAIALVLTKLA
jgi:uncharacterized coiled-coil protein SlyX